MHKHIVLLSFICLAILSSCSQPETPSQTVSSKDLVTSNQLCNIRLGDGVPLCVQLSIRWKVEDMNNFLTQFNSLEEYDSLILQPREGEILSQVALKYPNVDSVFTSHREEFIYTVKQVLLENLGEEGVTIKEVILSDITFPVNYVAAREDIGMKALELEAIRQKSVVELENSLAAQKKAEADGQVAMVQAEAEGKVQAIQAKTEESRRKSLLAKAQTDKEVSEMNALAEKKRLELLAEADLKKKTDLKDLEVQKVRDLNEVELDKLAKLDDVEIQKELKLAQLCSENPVYASFLVNKELASKVQIAVLPTSGETNVFGDLLNQSMVAK